MMSFEVCMAVASRLAFFAATYGMSRCVVGLIQILLGFVIGLIKVFASKEVAHNPVPCTSI
jgi:hypothetical protein